MKTMKELNEKIWYRAIKVIYMIIFILVISFGLFQIYEINYKKDSFISNNLQPKEVEFLKFQKSKGADAETAFKKLKIARDAGLFGEQEIKNKKIYLIKIFFQILGYSILLTIITYIIFFQIINRTFYYIILGNLFPPKN